MLNSTVNGRDYPNETYLRGFYVKNPKIIYGVFDVLLIYMVWLNGVQHVMRVINIWKN